MTSSSWQTARDRIVVPTTDYSRVHDVRLTLAALLVLLALAFAGPGSGANGMVGAAPAAGSPAPPTDQSPQFQSRVDLVNLGVTVTDKRGRLISDLTRDQFTVVEDGHPQTITYFAGAEAPAPEMHLGLLLDVSGSMESDIAFTRTAAIKFLNTVTEALDVTLVDFDTEVRVARYEQREFARLIERIRAKKTGGETALFDAIGVYLDGAAGQDGRKIMLLYTDGGDTRSAIRLNELLDIVKASDVTIYGIGVFDATGGRVRGEEQLVLRQITEATGGKVFFPPSVKELDKVYEQVVAEIRAQYTLGYVSSNAKTDGSWRKIDIKINRPDARELRVRARRGYFALKRQ
jgi:Ca-activated chloride channel family protein